MASGHKKTRKHSVAGLALGTALWAGATASAPHLPLTHDFSPSQAVTNTRSVTAYQVDDSGQSFTPDEIMDPKNFEKVSDLHYVKVTGYLVYVAGTAPSGGTTTQIGIEADGDIHFELASTPAPRPSGVNPNGLVCEITPPYQLTNAMAIGRFVNQHNPSTYKKVTVYGCLRFGTEGATHSGYRVYPLGNSTFPGHWEIHPVEKVEVEGTVLGPGGNYVMPQPAARYKLTAADFQKPSMSNHGELRGKVILIQGSPDGSGDVQVTLDDGAGNKTLAVIPAYYVNGFDAQSVNLNSNLQGFSSVSGIEVGDSYTFDGMRRWTFNMDEGEAQATLEPVEMVSQ